MSQLPDHIINEIMMCVSHLVADIINEGLELIEELDFIINKGDTKMRFIDFDIEWRRQDIDEQIMRYILNNCLSKSSHITREYKIIGLFFIMSTWTTLNK